MYAKRVSPIRLPEIGQLHFSKKGYVTWSPEAGKWDNEKKRTIDKRFGIGILVDPANRTLFYPNPRYLQYLKENEDTLPQTSVPVVVAETPKKPQSRIETVLKRQSHKTPHWTNQANETQDCHLATSML